MLTLAVSHLSPSEALFWIAALIALGCLVAAGYCAFHDRWLATVLLVVVALFIGVIFLA